MRKQQYRQCGAEARVVRVGYLGATGEEFSQLLPVGKITLTKWEKQR